MSVHVSEGNLRKYLEPGETICALRLVVYQLIPSHETSRVIHQISYTRENLPTAYYIGSLDTWPSGFYGTFHKFISLISTVTHL